MNAECSAATRDNPGRCGTCEGCLATRYRSFARQQAWIEVGAESQPAMQQAPVRMRRP